MLAMHHSFRKYSAFCYPQTTCMQLFANILSHSGTVKKNEFIRFRTPSNNFDKINNDKSGKDGAGER